MMTGTYGDGTKPVDNCADWTSASAPAMLGGTSAAGSGGWSDGVGSGCNGATSIYCFETTFNRTLSPPGTTGRKAFVTAASWNPATGIAAADTLCRAEAATALPGAATFSRLPCHQPYERGFAARPKRRELGADGRHSDCHLACRAFRGESTRADPAVGGQSNRR